MPNFKTPLLISILMVVMSGAAPAFADDSNTYINGSLGIQNFNNDRLLKSEKLISIGLEHRYSNGWGAEVFWMDSTPAGERNTDDVDLTQYGIDGLYYFKSGDIYEHDIIQSYGAVGLAHADFKKTVGTDNETHLRAGLGLRMVLSDHWSVKADTRLIYSVEAETLDSTLTVGLSYALNNQSKVSPPADSDNDGVIDINDNCPTTPTGVQVDSKGCAFDTDGDGVSNHADNCPTTPAGASVDAKGCAVDSDNDGVADHNDNCLTSPVGVAVDTNGCVLDSDGDDVADYKDNCPATPAGRAVDGVGCKFILTHTEEVTLNINFAYKSVDITEEHIDEIEKVGNFLTKYSKVNTVIEGHTDDIGPDDYNTNLSMQRAESVMTVLTERFGVAADRMSVLGYGEARPIESNDTEAGRLANRRVVAVMQAEVSE
jgi:OOP family OmpA-OmpF porin